MTATNTESATDLLRQQHHHVMQMLSQFATSTGASRRELFDCLRATLAVHETAEEIVMYPVLRGINEQGRHIADARIAEEDEAKHALVELEKLGVDGEGFDTKFETFRKGVLAHAQAEESEAFALLDTHCDSEKLQKMGSAILAAEKLAPTHAHPHGPDGAVGNLLVGPFVAIVDKVRDAMNRHGERKAG